MGYRGKGQGAASQYLVRKRGEVFSDRITASERSRLEPPDDVVDGGAHYEVFLLQAEGFSLEELKGGRGSLLLKSSLKDV